MSGIPDGKCPRCGEVRPRDGRFDHVRKDGSTCKAYADRPSDDNNLSRWSL